MILSFGWADGFRHNLFRLYLPAVAVSCQIACSNVMIQRLLLFSVFPSFKPFKLRLRVVGAIVDAYRSRRFYGTVFASVSSPDSGGEPEKGTLRA